MDPNIKLIKVSDKEMDTKTYQSALGALMHMMLATRPDLAYSMVTPFPLDMSTQTGLQNE